MLSSIHLEVIEIIKKSFPYLNVLLEYQIPKSNLRLDIYLSDLNLGIEINGIQHYEENKFFHKNELDFLNSNIRDKNKKIYSLNENIEIFYIKYNEKNFKNKVLDKIMEVINNLDIITFFENDKIYSNKQIKNLSCSICKNELSFSKKSDNEYEDTCCGLMFTLIKINNKSFKSKVYKRGH